MSTAANYLATAKRLLSSGATDTDVRRAVSATYYALFHHLCWHFSQIMTRPSAVTYTRAWLQTYRYPDHGPAKKQCHLVERQSGLDFPPALVAFSVVFSQMQERRIDADYNPAKEISALDAYGWIVTTEQTISSFEAATPEQQRAFVLFICLKPKAR
jgi:uncharacterized protein (UPF0332 family)